MEADSREIARMWRVYRTIYQMCKDRGYLVGQRDLERDLESFKLEFAQSGSVDRNRLTFLVQNREDPSDQMLVFFPEDSSVGIKPIRTYAEKMVSQGVLSQMSSKYQMEAFNEADLLVNITQHELVPKHVLLSVEEKKALLGKYHLKEAQLPRIQITDPVARYYGLKRGQIVKIIRASETAGRYVTYRLCI
ncbi:hypothetical protein BB559_001234 [Furculomyces boomerangus]|uniref:DNA-directed RNA polymerases I, II, and III subunit RPABC1 n=2 Tax=Harpellales TaxID=61421 RepID=A0A2T9Z2N4_9FUNG|nr:hypothetical protein BB559_001234 [Furculomyces boomerangus]PWA00678.1 hypothetical protein BB558_003268 [Smittium angustum]